MGVILAWIMFGVGFTLAWWMKGHWDDVSQWRSVKFLGRMRSKWFSSEGAK